MSDNTGAPPAAVELESAMEATRTDRMSGNTGANPTAIGRDSAIEATRSARMSGNTDANPTAIGRDSAGEAIRSARMNGNTGAAVELAGAMEATGSAQRGPNTRSVTSEKDLKKLAKTQWYVALGSAGHFLPNASSDQSDSGAI